MKHAEAVTFGGSGLDRAGHLRADSAKLQRLLDVDAPNILPIWRGKPLFHRNGGDEVSAGWVRHDSPVLADATGGTVFLGFDDDKARFAQDISLWEPEDLPDTLGAFFDPSEQLHPDAGEGHVFSELRGVMTALSPRDAELVASAKAILGWHSTHGFCAKCGAATVMGMGGWQRDCPTCHAHHFPRTDPVVIMLITHGNSVLMGRSPGWPDGMFSLLAGFVEPGEPIEAAVRREVFEEAGIHVGPVNYLSSQPWPFPSSLMFGCHGVATSTKITIDPTEIEEAKWVTREQMMDVFAGNSDVMKPARKGAIAHFLLLNWLADTLE